MSILSPEPRSPASDISELWYTRCGVPTASSLALAKGWLHESFKELEIELQSVRAADAETVRNSHYDHALRRMFREGGNVPAIWARSRGRPTVVVGITWVDEFQAIVTRADSDIIEPAQLEGRRLGLPVHPGDLVDHSRASSRHGFASALSVAALREDDVTFVDIDSPRFDIRENRETGLLAQRDGRRLDGGVTQALLQGDVDAIYLKGAPGIETIERLGLRVVFDINQHPDPLVHVNNAVPRPVTADRDLVRERPDLVTRYLSVLLQTGHWAAQNPDEVVRLIAAETGTSEESAARAYGPALHRSFVPSLDPLYVRGLERQKDFLWRAGFLPADFAFDDWIVQGPLEEAQAQLGTAALRAG